ncbi:MAG: hypothetical protein K1X78_13920 [Verrucomicrobiaceae bacterium]|nr:hypothetical protein [Verrucomicrobiaceae bacterium]
MNLLKHLHRRHLIAITLAALAVPLGSIAQEKIFKAGAATSNITPPLGMTIVGNFAPQPVSKHVHDELHVRCLALDDGKTKLVFAVADNLHLARDVWDEAKKKLETDTGIPASHMMFSSTHTHSSVSAITDKGVGFDYRTLVISRVVDGVKRALNNLEPARIAWGTGKLPQWLGNRRWILKEGVTNPNPFGGEDRAVMNPSSTLIPRLAGPAGPTNPEVYCLSLQATDGRQIALMANYWLHYVGGVGREDLSADYFGEFCRRIEQSLGAPCVGLLPNGPCGDVNSNDYSGKTKAKTYKPYEKIAIVANDLAQEVLRVHKSLQHQDWVPLSAAASDLELAARRPTPEQMKWAEGVLAKPKDATPVHRLEQPYAERVMEAKRAQSDTIQAFIQAFRIGDLGIASIPFEVFTETGLEIKAKSPFKDTFTIELANGANGYLPTPTQHDLGGYETWLGTNRVEREASVKITAKALELLQGLRAAP